MMGAIGFATPWLLGALVALPVLWWLLRAVPPAPVVRRFPGVALLLGLFDTRSETDKTPWWLLLLRALAVAALILGFAGPMLNPQASRMGDAPLLVVTDASWASARDWPRRTDRMAEVLAEAARADRPVAVVALTDLPQGPLPLREAGFWSERLDGLAPAPFSADPDSVAAWARDLPDRLDSYWLSDGLDAPYRAPLTEALLTRGSVSVFETSRPVFTLAPPRLNDGVLSLQAARLPDQPATDVDIIASGRDPAGVERTLARATASFDAGAQTAQAELVLQPELRNRITRFQIAGNRSAGAVALDR